MRTLDEAIAIYRAKLETISSELGLLKGTVEDAGATEASAEVEKAQDCVDGALQCLRAAIQYAEPLS